MGTRKIWSVAVTFALAAAGTQLAPGAGSAAVVASATNHSLGAHPTGSKSFGRVNFDRIAKQLSHSSGVRAADVAPVSNFSPACYGDSRSINPVGGSLDPVSFGAFYNCAYNEWTFEVQTADSWALSNLGLWGIQIDTDGNPNDNCGGFEYGAIVAQSTSNPGQFAAGVTSLGFDPIANQCTTGSVTNATFSYTSNSVAISFPATAIGNNPSIIWNALLQDRSEELNGSGGNSVPNSATVEIFGAPGVIADSVPGPGPQAGSCPTQGFTGVQVASTSNSTKAAATLRKAGFPSVHDYGEGIVSFTGDPTSASRTLTSAGINSRISPSEPFHFEGTVNSSSFSGTPNDPNYGSQWNLAAINASGAWNVTTGSNVVVADVDTGVDFTHVDLPSPQLVPGIDESQTVPVAINYASGNTDQGQSASGHGTAVAGVIAAATNNGQLVSSLGWNTSVMPVKVNLDATTNPQPDAQIAAGILWAADITKHPSENVRVINLSLGSACTDATVQSAIQNAQNKGILIVAAAGNAALSIGFDPSPNDFAYNNPPIYPAAWPGVLAVGATGRDGKRAFYSDTGNYVSLVAPGGSGDGNTADDMLLLHAGGGTTSDFGTSFAAPEVAATAALILSVNPTLTPSQVSELITGSATDLGPTGRDVEYGYGMLNAGVALADTPPPATSLPSYGTFVSLAPARILDTRTATGVPSVAPLGAGGTLNLQVTGAGNVPASGVSAVVLNTTVTDATAPSYLTVWPTGQARPLSSNLNFVAGQTVPNLVTVKVGTAGQVSFFNAAGNADVIADVEGYYTDGTVPAGSTFVPLSPTRILDTRNTSNPVVAGHPPLTVQVTGGTSGVPSTATGVVMNVTVTQPSQAGYLTVYPTDQPQPLASNLNFVGGLTVPNLVSVKLSPTGQVNIFNSNGSVQVIADVQGYFTATGDTSGSRFFPLVNHRILDTRYNIGGLYGAIQPSSTVPAPIVGQGGVLDGASSAVMNTTVTQPTSTSYLTVYPDGTSQPTASDLNYVAGQTVPNLVSAKIGGDGFDDYYNAFGAVYVLSDIAGYYGNPGT